jgi:hypothetical protein
MTTWRHIPADIIFNIDCPSSCYCQIRFVAPGLLLQLWLPRDNQNVEAPISHNRFRLWQLFFVDVVLFLIIAKYSKRRFVILEKQMFQWNLWILFLFCGGPGTTNLRPRHFTPGDLAPGTDCVGGWLGSRPGLNVLKKRNRAGFRGVQPVPRQRAPSV